MATPELQKPIAANIRPPAKSPRQTIQNGRYQTARGSILGWMALDAITVLLATTAATIIDFHITPIHGARSFVHNQLIRGETVGVLTALLVGFIAVLIIVNRSLLLYSPVRLASHLHEQRLSLQACVITTLMLMGALYLLHAEMVPRRIVLISVLLITVGLALRRAIFRIAMYHRFERGLNTRNVIIVGLGSEALALRHHLKNIRQLGFVFKGFVYVPGVDNIHEFRAADDLLGPLEQLFDFARQHFVDEIFFTAVCERSVINRERYPNRILRLVFVSIMIESWRTTGKQHWHVGEFLYRIMRQAAKAWRHSVVSVACATGSSTIGRSACAGPGLRLFSLSRWCLQKHQGL